MSSGSGAPRQYHYYNDPSNPTQQAINNAYSSGPLAGGKGGGAPPMDYVGAAEKQAQSGKDATQAQTQANRPNQATSFGSESWTEDPTTGAWTQSTSLNPELQGLQGQFQGQLSGAAGADAFQRASNAAYGQETSRLDPMWNQREEQERQMLASQGLDPSSQAYRTEMDNFDRGRNDAYQTAMNSSIGLGEQAQAQNFAEGMQGLQGLQGFETGMPGFNAAGSWGATPFMQAYEDIGGTLNNNAQLNQEAKAELMQGITSMWGSLLGAAAKSGGGG